MNGPLPLYLNTFPGGGGPDDGPVTIRLGFVAEPVVKLTDTATPPLYSECLARMVVSESILLKGGEFVEDFEANGDIGLLDVTMLDIVFDALADQPRGCLGCNISPKTLSDRDTWNEVIKRLAARPWLAERLVLEITESCPLDEIEDVVGRLSTARRLGCRLAVDDFGAGFATPARLRRLDIEWDIIKLDRSCLGDPRKRDESCERLAYYLSLAGRLAPFVVVEGIETSQYIDLACEAGALYGQGWAFDGPVLPRFATPDAETGARLAAALLSHGSIVRPVTSISNAGVAPARHALGSDRKPNYLLSKVDHLGDRVRALVARARSGGAV